MAKPKIIHSGSTTLITLRGDKTKRQEPDECYINFPGGHIGVTRTSDGAYWAHFTRTRAAQAVPGVDVVGEITDARIDKENEHASARSGAPLMDPEVYHVAMRIEPA